MTWQLRIPYRDRSEPIAAVGDLARNLTGEDRAVARQLALDAAMNGMRTVGDLLDGMERASATERRQMLDRARERVGLPDTKTAEARERFEAINQSLPPIDTARDPSGRIPATCSAPGCRNFEADSTTGAVALLPVTRFWCPDHADLAAPGDGEPYVAQFRFRPSGAIEHVETAEAERERQEREVERARARRSQRQAERQAEAESQRRHEAAVADHYAPKGAGFSPLPGYESEESP